MASSLVLWCKERRAFSARGKGSGVTARFSVKRLGILILLISAALGAQSNTGELRLTVTDPAGLGVKAAVEISNLASQYHNTLVTDGQGKLVAERLPYGVYSVHIRQ